MSSLVQRVFTPGATQIARQLRLAGFECRAVGGAVRDALVGADIHDVDLATDATPDEVTAIMEDAGRRVLPTGIAHGTVTVLMDHEEIEVTTLRIDTECDGRHATVAFTRSWQLDAERRDFTINAMSMDDTGQLFDYFGGYTDLMAGRVLFVGDAQQRIDEDALRLIRWVRFQGRFLGEADPKTLAIVKSNIGRIIDLSGERLWSEFKKIIALPEDKRVAALTFLTKAGFWQCFGMNTQLDWKLLTVDHPVDTMAIACSDLKTNVTERFKFSRVETDRFNWMIDNIGSWWTEQSVKETIAGGQAPREWVFSTIRINGFGRLADKLEDWNAPTFPIRGQDVLDAGVPPGPAVGTVLSQLKTSWLNDLDNEDRTSLLKKMETLI